MILIWLSIICILIIVLVYIQNNNDNDNLAYAAKKKNTTSKPSKPSKPPTSKTLQHAASVLTSKNKSGKLPSTSSYSDLVKQGYLKFTGKKWTVNKPGTNNSSFSGNIHAPKDVVTVHPHPSSSHSSFNIASQHVIDGNKSSSFCSNAFGGYAGAKKCGTKGNSTYVEGDITDPSKTKLLFKTASDKAVKAAYIAVGTANQLNGGSSRVSGLTTYGGGCMYTGKELGGCINWGNSSVSATALSYIKKQIDTAKSLGANAIRLDQVDVCENNNGVANKNCQAGFNKALTTISHYAGKQGLGIIPNNSPNSQKTLVAAQNNGGATVLASMVDDTGNHISSQVKATQDAIGTDIPIITLCTSHC